MALLNSKLLHKKGLVAKVLELLNNLQALPEAGIVAGQSVASAIDMVLGTGTPVFNDIDVFQTDDMWPGEMVPHPYMGGNQMVKKYVSGKWKTKLTSTLVFTGDLLTLGPNPKTNPGEIEDDDYSHFSTHQSLYQVKSTVREGLLNKILVMFMNSHHYQHQPLAFQAMRQVQSLLLGFDINSTQVAIDLRSKKLYFTPAFEKYFATRQLEIVGLFTPIHSILRYFKKRQELQAYGNDKATLALFMRRMQQVDPHKETSASRAKAFRAGDIYLPKSVQTRLRHLNKSMPSGPVGTGFHGAPLVMGAKYKELLDKYGAPVSDLITPIKHPSKDLWLLAATDVTKKLVHKTALPSEPSLVVPRFNEQFYPVSKQVANRIALFDEFLPTLKDRAAALFRTNYINKGPAYLEGIESPLRAMLGKLISEHHELERVIAGLAIRDQIKFIQQAKLAMARAELPNVWSAFAYKSSTWALRATTTPALFDGVLAVLKPTSLRVAEPLPLPATVNGIEVVELLSGAALSQEGHQMLHCVGGYVGHVAQGHSRIISLRQGPDRYQRSTTEWRVAYDIKAPIFAKAGTRSYYPLKLTLAQSRTYRNEKPNAELLAAEKELRTQANDWLRSHPRDGWELLQRAELQALDFQVKERTAEYLPFPAKKPACA